MSVPLSPVGNLCETLFMDGVCYHDIAAEAEISWQRVAQFLSRRGYWQDCWGARRGLLAPAERDYCALVDALPPSGPDDAVFARLWALDVPGATLGRIFGHSDSFASQRARALDLRPRGMAKVVKPAAVAPVQKPVVVKPSMDPLDWAVLQTGGRYGALAEVCAQKGVGMTRALQIWHRLRASGQAVAA